MAALPYPTYGISHLYLFPVYQTREAFRQATGLEPPPYDEKKPIKSWFDPRALENPRRKIIYENVIGYASNGAPLVGPDGKPVLEPLVLDREFAATVNIPPKAPGVPDLPHTGEEIPVPLRPLEPNEELFFQFGGSVAVKNKDLFQKLAESAGFSEQDRLLLRKIAAKLGVAD
ncbi:MAG: hypothetical protein NZV14_12430 [Bryobacteraceae bacterium]|nr:hypothetical protein [Bryobacteraceae bacterium]MDW8378960.1 hypothetical protein [Bryobacterales bacterium]